MSLGGTILLILLAGCVVLGLAVAWLWQDRKGWKAEAKRYRDEAASWEAETYTLRGLALTTQKIEEKRNEQKDAVAAGGFAASVGVLSDIARRGKPKT